MTKELEVFASILKRPQFREYLETERAKGLKALVAATDMMVVHRAQGRVQLIEEMLALFDKSGGLR